MKKVVSTILRSLDSFDRHKVVCNISYTCSDIFHHTTIQFTYQNSFEVCSRKFLDDDLKYFLHVLNHILVSTYLRKFHRQGMTFNSYLFPCQSVCKQYIILNQVFLYNISNNSWNYIIFHRMIGNKVAY